MVGVKNGILVLVFRCTVGLVPSSWWLGDGESVEMTVVRLVVVPIDDEVRPLEVPLSFCQLAVLFSLSSEKLFVLLYPAGAYGLT